MEDMKACMVRGDSIEKTKISKINSKILLVITLFKSHINYVKSIIKWNTITDFWKLHDKMD